MIRNKIKDICDSRGLTAYQLFKGAGISTNTAYRLLNDSSAIPQGIIIDKLCTTYNLSPNDIIEIYQ